MNSQCTDVLMSSLKSMRAARRVLVAGPVVVEGHLTRYRYSSGLPLAEVGGDEVGVAGNGARSEGRHTELTRWKICGSSSTPDPKLHGSVPAECSHTGTGRAASTSA